MQAISLWQPWASAIERGLKENETRHWTISQRGRIAIHAAKRWTNAEQSVLLSNPHFAPLRGLELPLGAVICTAELLKIVQITPKYVGTLSPLEISMGNYMPGRFAWVLVDVRPLREPLPFSGRQGMFVVSDELIKAYGG